MWLAGQRRRVWRRGRISLGADPLPGQQNKAGDAQPADIDASEGKGPDPILLSV